MRTPDDGKLELKYSGGGRKEDRDSTIGDRRHSDTQYKINDEGKQRGNKPNERKKGRQKGGKEGAYDDVERIRSESKQRTFHAVDVCGAYDHTAS